MLHVMVSVDLKEAGDKRNDFNAILKGWVWHKLENVDTVWSFNVPKWEQINYDTAKKYVTDKLLAAAKESKLEEVTAVAQIGNAVSFGHQIVKKNGSYVSADFNPIARKK